jgi:transposase
MLGVIPQWTPSMDPKQIKLAVNLYAKLQSGNAVAKRMDVSHSTAYRLLRAGGVDLPDRHGPEVQERKRKLRGDVVAAVAADYAAGMSNAALVEKYGASMWAIRTAVKSAGVELRGQGGKYRVFSDDDQLDAVALYGAGWSQAKIAAKFGAHQVTVGRMLRNAGVILRKPNASGADHGSWKGGRAKSGSYIGVRVEIDDPLFCMAEQHGYVLEHRLVMARQLGRALLPHETVHHIDGDKTNNKPSNLQLRFGKHGKGVCMVCADCGSHRINYKELT